MAEREMRLVVEDSISVGSSEKVCEDCSKLVMAGNTQAMKAMFYHVRDTDPTWYTRISCSHGQLAEPVVTICLVTVTKVLRLD